MRLASTSGIDLSIVIPTHNEAQRLPPTLRAIDALRGNGFGRIEVVVVDDGSRDRTAELAAAAGARVQRMGGRHGAGAAVRAGMLAARGERILLCDADGAVPFAELHPLAEALDRGFDLAAGSRVLWPASVEVPQPMHRVVMGRAWAALVQRLLPSPVQDTQCGFKLLRRDAARELFLRSRARGFAFHAEILALAAALGMRVIELPVRWRDQPGSKVRLVRDSAHMLGELTAAALRHRWLAPPAAEA